MKQNRIKLAYFLALVCLLSIFLSIFGANSEVLAKSTKLEIVLPQYEDLNDKLKDEDIKLKAWDITSKYSDISDLDKNELVNELNDISIEKLNKQFQNYTFTATYKDDRLELEIGNGIFFFNNIFKTENNIYTSQFIVEVNDKSPLTIELIDKLKIQPKEYGKVKLVKVDQNDIRLEGVGFKFYQKIDNKFIQVPLIGEYEYNKDGRKDQILYTNKNGEISIDKLPYGTYLFREVKALDGYKMIEVEKEFTINTNREIIVKVVNDKIEYGDHKFLKIGDDSKQTPLKGAVFKVVRYIEGNVETVIQNDKQLMLESDKNGEFAVKDLPYGNYALWEVKAPKGFKKLISPINFTVDNESSTKVIIIKNEKTPKINIPFTGDYVFSAILLASCVLFVTGYKISKGEKINN